MKQTTILYGLSLALGAFFLQWTENQYGLKLLSTEIYIVLVAVLFTGLGIWVGTKLGKKASEGSFEQNKRAIETLRLSKREIDVLKHLAIGQSNQEIANSLFVSISTVKTHLVHLYQKMEVSSRTKAVQKAKSLNIIQ